MDERTNNDKNEANAAPEVHQQFGTPPAVPPYSPYSPYPPYPPAKRKKKWAAGLLSFLFPGLGHLYAGDMQRGLFFMLLFVGNIVGIVFFSEGGIVPLIVLLAVMIPVVFFYSLFDALQATDRVNQQVQYPYQVPDPGADSFSPPAGSTYRRSIGGSQIGIALIGVGALIFLTVNKPAWLESLIESSGSIVGAVILIGAGVLLFVNESRKNK
ncbi:hypothetical protein [Paenibacillus alkalitolerans]|uniref:hypothetical protein n=1 Tax=Paenibacillus alkalitolerans TaxID=2799335 RepID=UPI0018F68DC5|nr:hypothetical protein [Paenibacillus alkalitolerans]